MFKLQLPAHIQLKEKETSDCSDLLSSVCPDKDVTSSRAARRLRIRRSEVKDVIKAEKFRRRFLNLRTAVCLKLNPLCLNYRVTLMSGAD